jgi:hypothetical protein
MYRSSACESFRPKQEIRLPEPLAILARAPLIGNADKAEIAFRTDATNRVSGTAAKRRHALHESSSRSAHKSPSKPCARHTDKKSALFQYVNGRIEATHVSLGQGSCRSWPQRAHNLCTAAILIKDTADGVLGYCVN